jgi:fructose-bisphosphate aldolase, class II
VVDRAHPKGISVEAELGMLGGVEEDIKVDEGHACLTNPEEAVEFIKQTKCDSLAAAIGTSHGAYKFKGQQALHFDVIEKIRDNVKKAALPPTPIVMQVDQASRNQRSSASMPLGTNLIHLRAA